MDSIRRFYERDYLRLHPDLDRNDAARKLSQLYAFLGEIHSSINHISRPIILDIGCGCGRMLEDIAVFLKARAIGLDFSFSILSQAKKTFPTATYVQADAGNLPIKTEKIDLIYFADLLEHLDEPARFLKQLRGPRFLLMHIPLESGFLSDLIYKYRKFFGKPTNREIYGHLHRWNRRGCLNLLKDAGLKPIYCQALLGKKHQYDTWRGKAYGFLSTACCLSSPAMHQWLFGGYVFIAFCKSISEDAA